MNETGELEWFQTNIVDYWKRVLATVGLSSTKNAEDFEKALERLWKGESDGEREGGGRGRFIDI